MILFPADLTLENERVMLRPLQMDDLGFLIPFAENEPDTWKYSPVSAAGQDGMRRYVEEAIRQRLTMKEYPFIVFDKQAGQYAGSTRFYDINLPFATTQLGFTWYGRRFQRTGLNRHCKLLLLRYAFEEWNMERVEFRADKRNERSIRAMKEIGCTVEGLLRSNMPVGSGRRDSVVLSILKNEWFDSVKENLIRKIR